MSEVYQLIAALQKRDVRLWIDGDLLRYDAPLGVLAAGDLEQLRLHKRSVIELLKQSSAPGNALPLAKRPRADVVPLSYAQQRLWFLAQLEQSSANYNVPLALRLKGKLNQSALLKSIETIVERHEVLRTRFVETDDGVTQQITPPGQFQLALECDATEELLDDREAVAQICAAEARRELDLSRDSLIRARLLQLADDEHVLLVTMHHSVTDGWSMMVFFRELVALYDAYDSGRASPLQPLKIQYADFAHWQRQWLSGEVLAAQQTYWQQQLTGIDPVLALPTDRPRPPAKTYAGAVEHFCFSRTLLTQLHELSQAQGATLYMTLLAAFDVLLSRYSNQTDIAIGTPIANRPRPELEGLIGFFVNTLVMRADLSGAPSFIELLQRVKRTALAAYANQDVPFEQLVELLQPQRSLSYMPFFQVMFTLQNLPSFELAAADMEISLIESEARTAKFDLSLSMYESDGGLQGKMEYNTDLFDAGTVQRLIGHYERLLTAIVAAPAEKISRYDFLSRPERHQLLVDWNNTAAAYPQEQCIHESFEEQVERAPDAIAVVYEDEQLTYGELNKRANRVAHCLRGLGVGPDELVAICVERSLEMIVGLLGILKAGGAYVPLDPSYPKERLTYMLQDAAPLVVLTQERLKASLSETAATLIALDADWCEIEKERDRDIDPASAGLTSRHLAYVIYTSGSTGQPKGVMVEHRQLANLVQWHRTAFGLKSAHRSSCVAGFGFDAATWEIFPALCAGASLALAPAAASGDPDALLTWWKSQRLDISFLPTPIAELAFSSGIGNSFLQTLLVGGDRLRHLPEDPGSFSVVNNYGPTECTVVATSGRLQGFEPVLHIGRPIGNTQIYILDAQLQPVPIGVAGEMYIGGAGVARGYLNRPELTMERFLKDPFSADPSARMYRTGDLARWRSDGTIEYLGRNDHQVKIRGYRIELGEIEAQLAHHPQVKEAVVIAREDVPGEKRLVAYYTVREEQPVEVEALRAHLRSRLPDYMTPSAYVALEALPLTPNGKLDRKALPAPEGDAYASRAYEAPQGVIEDKLAGIWQELLKVERVGRHDNFFELGGHSLLATSMTSRIRQTFAVELPLRTLFEQPTLAASAKLIDGVLKQEKALPELPLTVIDRSNQDLPLSYAQQRMWFLAQLEQSSANYNMPLALRLKGKLNQSALSRSVEAIVDRHEVLRTRFAKIDGKLAQQIIPPGQFRVALELESPGEITQVCAAEAGREFDLSRDTLIRARLIQLAQDEHVLLVTMHHSVTDGWSMAVFFRELVALYEAYDTGADSPLQPLKIQYADFAHWQRQWLRGEVLAAQQAYWRQQLAGVDPVLALPTDRPRPAIKTYAGAVERFSFSKTLQGQLNQLSQARGVTLYMTLLAAFNVLLSRYSNQTDIAVGTPIANRPRAELEGLIGFFVNTLVMRTDLSGAPSFVELLQRVKQMALAAYAHQDVPFEQLVELLQPQRSLSYTPFFQVMFALQNVPGFAVSTTDMQISPVEYGARAAKFDLNLSMLESDEGLQGEVEYNTDLFDASTVQRLIRHYEQLLTAIVAAPAKKIGQYDLLSESERQQLLVDWNHTASPYPAEKCLHELFAAQVERTPNAIAVEYEGQPLSYRALNERANQVAHYLIEQGVKPDTVVGLCLERSLEMIVGLLGIIKAGAAYVPIDPHYPVERIRYMLQDSSALLVLSQQVIVEKLQDDQREWIALDNREVHTRCIARQPTTNISREQLGSTAQHLAHVIYTSGSTGRPKGVLVEQQGVVRLVCGTNFIELNSSLVMLQQTTLCFDVSAFEIWAPLLNGGRLVVYGGEVMDIPRMMDTVTKAGVNTIALTPSLLQVWMDLYPQATPCVKTLVVAGEALSVARVVQMYRLNPQLQIIDAYGPTENSVYSVAYSVPKHIQLGDIKPIGFPIAQSTAYVMDAEQQLVPVGCVGELYVGGAGVARGYLNQPALTAEKFIDDPFSDRPGARLYKTGDLVRRLADGAIEYLGRRDDQVKIRGFRIELGEIESLLQSHEGVQSCVVLAREDVPGEKRLVAYYTVREGQGLEVEALRTHLKNGLPEYMVPSAYMVLDAIPLTPNGKVDRKALPAPDESALSAKEYEAPQGEIEEKVASIWRELLHVERVGRHDNFFELGGHSLLATSVTSQVRQAFAVELSLRMLFEHPTLMAFAGLIAKALEQSTVLTELPLTVVDRNNQALPLSYAQQRLWFLAQLEQSSANYNVPLALRLQGKLNQQALLSAIEAIVDRHEVLRTNFVEVDGALIQQITPPGQFKVALELHDATAAIAQVCAAEARREFDLSRGSLIRIRLIQLAENEHVLLVTMHHSVTDGWSMTVFFRELVALYDAYDTGGVSPLQPLKIQYADFAHWQRQWLSGEVLAAQQAYWRQQLADVDPVLALPTDRPRPAIKTYAGAVEHFSFSKTLQAQLNQLSQRQGVTLYMTLLAAFNVLLSRYSNQTDIAVGTPIANRRRAELEGLIGFFVNTLVMRTDLSGTPSFVELLQRVKQMALSAYAHQDVPFEQLVELLQPQRSLSYTPFFQVMFALQNVPSFTVSAADMQISPVEHEARSSKFDLSWSMYESDGGLQGEVEYNTDLFDAATVQRFIQHYERLLAAIVAAPAERISRYDLLSESERRQLLMGWNDTASAHPEQQCLHELFEAQVERTPDAIAAIYGNERLTYAQLEKKANQLAHYLIKRGVKSDVIVGIAVERSLEMLIGILGILKAGGAYAPLDPQYPRERLSYMLEDCATPALLTQQALVGQLPPFKGEVICLDSGWGPIGQESDRAPRIVVAASDLAYVIYTSGSTGKPKGVMNQHDGIVNHLLWRQERFDLTAADVVLQKTSFSFDVSVWEFFWPLMCGARLVFAEPQGHKDNVYLAELIKRHQVSTVHFGPSMLSVMLATPQFAECDSLKRVFCGGEALSVEHVRQFSQCLPRTELHNLYGPTEAAINVSCWTCTYQAGMHIVPIGKPVANTQLYVLDEELQPVPVGVSGELYIGGVQLARGYLNQEELTARAFIPNPLPDTPGARLYKTGDVARYLADGNIEYLGRRDHQVKVRGFRIELGEIESQLLSHTSVQSCVVLAREDVLGEKRLVAYYTVREGQTVEVEALRAYLKNGLPEYMVPGACVVLDAIPLTPNGKIDRKALPAPDQSALPVKEYEAPQGEIEEKVASIWRELLRVERVGRQDNFFELGGHSLLATSVTSRVRQALAVELSLRTLFEQPTLAGYAGSISKALDQATAPAELPLTRVDRNQALPLSYAQQRLWFLAQLEQSSSNYNVPLALRLKGKLNQAALQRAIETIVDRHEVLRTNFVEIDGALIQRITPAGQFKVALELHGAQESEALTQICVAEASREFDLSRDSLIRARLIQLAQDEHVLLVTMHHSVTDGWSMTVFFRELVALYDAYDAGAAAPLQPMQIQYADFAHWQRQWLSGEVLAVQQAYWQQQLAGIDPVLALPTDRPRPAVKTYAGAVERFAFSKTLQGQLNQLSQAQGVTLYMTLLAAFNVLLSRYSNQTDIAVGTPIANRPRAELEGLIGFFVNTLVMRTDLSGAPSFVELLQRVRGMALAAYAHQDIPFEQLVELLQPQRSLSYTPFFQVMFTLQNVPSFVVSTPDMEISPVGHGAHTAKFDLNLSVYESENGLQGGVEYNTDLFDATTVQRLIRHYEQLLTAIVAAPARKIGQYDLLSESERRQLLIDWNDTASPYPAEKCLHELFAEQVERTPNAIAVEYEGQTLSYFALNQRANKVAHYLIEQGVKPDTVVGLCLERSLEMIVGLLGIIKAGAAYVPIDPHYPVERIRYILQDSGALLVLSQQAIVEKLQDDQREWIALDNREVHARYIAQQPTANISRAQLGSTPQHLAHVIYTSGSTGRPKGVLVEQQGVVRLVCGTNFIELNSSLVMLQQTTLCFDVSAFEIWAPLLNGGRLVVYGGEVMDIPRMMDTVTKAGVNTIALTPSLLQVWMDLYPQATPCVKTLVVAGEALSVARVVQMYRLNPQLQIIDAYGPTENSVYSVAYSVPKHIQLGDIKPIGFPIAQSTAYVMDAEQQLVPVGCVGELYVGGAGVARGYLNQPALTAEKFIDDPFSDRPGARLYKTGDLVRRLADGAIEYLGRRDDQVKIRGFRIELGEIESLLLSHASVQSCAVLMREDVVGDKRLVAYLVLAGGARGQQTEIQNELRANAQAHLPDYMEPSAYVVVSHLPITANGKLDRKALPAPDTSAYQQRIYEAPQGEIEEKVASIWQALLQVERVGRQDNFFELGGHSLLATSVTSRVRQTFAVELSLRTLFEQPTLVSYAGLVSRALDQATTPTELPLTVVDRNQALPLSYAQQRLWFLAQLEQSSANYNVPLALRLKGKLNQAALLKAIEAIVDRHEVLRTNLVEVDGELTQQITPPGQFKAALELRNTGESLDAPEAVVQICAAEARREFDLSCGGLIRARLLQLAQDEHVLLVTMHHSVTDGWSMAVFFRELVALYEAYDGGANSPLQPLKIQYADFAHWQRQWLSGEVLAAQQAYWRQQLAGVDPVLALPTDRPRPAIKTYAGAVECFSFNKTLRSQLSQLSQAQGVTLYMTLLAAFNVLLSRYSNQTDIAVGTPIANRPRAELEGLIGFFVNTLVMRTDLSGAPSFVELLQRVKQMALAAYAHQDVPFEQLVELLQPQRSLSYTPFFQVMFALQNVPSFTMNAADMQISPVEYGTRAAKFDLNLSMLESDDGLQGEVEYNTDLFDATTVQRLIRHFEQLLTAIVAAPAKKIGQYDLLSESERQQLLVDWNDTASPYPAEKCLHELFAAQVERTPNAIAVEYEGQPLSYRELNERANQVAHYLIEQGVKPDTVAGLCLERSLEMIVGLLGIIKAGAAYVPIDPHYPVERIRYMLQDSSALLVLSQQVIVEKLQDDQREWIALDNREVHTRCIARQPTTNISREQLGSTPQHLAHVIYTSGSTGRPKGVLVEQQGVVRLVCGTNFIELNSSLVMLQQTTLCFDVSAFEIWAPLLNGGRLVVYGGEVMDIPRMMDTVTKAGVNTIALTPSLLQVWMDLYPQAVPCVKTLVVAGEALSVARVVQMYRLNPQLQIIDAYGPTENSVYSVAYSVPKHIQLGDIKPIGFPIAQSTAYMMDAEQQLVPVGCVGELYVGGAGVARGYLNQPALTAEKFIDDPFSDRPGARLYKTGDLARRLADGAIEYLGRRDDQVKIRGFRIELGEIESLLLSHAGVQSCAVLAREDIPGEKRLVAYLVLAASNDQSQQTEIQNELRASVQAHLPSYMAPSAYVVVSHLPMTSNGKLDRRALPAPSAGSYQQRASAPPATATERAIAEIWQDLLAVPQVWRQDNFFELGGHSLLAIRALAALNKEFLVDVPLIEFMQSASLRELASTVDGYLEKSKSNADEILQQIRMIEALSAEELENLLKN